MTSTLIKYNVILIVLCIGITLIHNSSEATVKKEVNLYYDPFNPQCRSVLLTLGALDLELNLKRIYLFHSEQLPEDFRNINSLHTLPVMQDGDLVLSESNAIIVHLVRKYGGQDDHPLYPNNPKIQAKVNQGLHFNNSYFSQAFEIPHIFRGILKTAEVEDKIHEALNFLEEILEKSTWTAGNTITVADFALVASISTFEVVDFNLGNYQQIQNWLSKCKTTMASYDTANQEGIYELKSLLESKNGFQNKSK
uniref:Glutathione S-transferase D6 n=1 Tax=Acyrthosiphon pisum TaxID=7029 RepID=I6R5N3_ACYPI|nr:glutathione S-transferase D6 [Acyrthosiphon pisum]